VQLLATCGVVGFVGYVAHRTQSIVSFIKNPSFNRLFFAIILVTFIALNLFDIYIFNLFPTLVYTAFFAIFSRLEKVKDAELMGERSGVLKFFLFEKSTQSCFPEDGNRSYAWNLNQF
jgi:hypothetical protein